MANKMANNKDRTVKIKGKANRGTSKDRLSTAASESPSQSQTGDTAVFKSLIRQRSPSTDLLSSTAVIWKTALGSIVAWEVARWSGSNHPYLAPLTLILCLQATVGQSLRFAWQRSVGTVIGVLIVGLFAQDLPMTAWMLGLVLLISTGVMKALGLSDKVIHQIALSVLFVWYFEQHSPGYGWDRAKDTIIGALTAAVFMILIAPPNQTKKAAGGLQQFMNAMANAVSDTGLYIRQGYLPTGAWTAEAELQSVRQQLHQTMGLMTQAAQSTRFNLYVSKRRERVVQEQFDVVRTAFLHFAELTQTLSEWANSGKFSGDQARAWGDMMTQMSRWIQDLNVRMVTETNDTGYSAPPEIPSFIDGRTSESTQEHQAGVDTDQGGTTNVGDLAASATPYALLAHHEAKRLIETLSLGLRQAGARSMQTN